MVFMGDVSQLFFILVQLFFLKFKQLKSVMLFNYFAFYRGGAFA